MLDTKEWLEEKADRKLYYKFYEKPTKNRFVMRKSSAMPN